MSLQDVRFYPVCNNAGPHFKIFCSIPRCSLEGLIKKVSGPNLSYPVFAQLFVGIRLYKYNPDTNAFDLSGKIWSEPISVMIDNDLVELR